MSTRKEMDQICEDLLKMENEVLLGNTIAEPGTVTFAELHEAEGRAYELVSHIRVLRLKLQGVV